MVESAGWGFHGGVYCLRFFSRDEMELEDVPEVTHGSHEIDTRVTLCLVPLHPSQEQARPLPLSFPHKYTVWSGGGHCVTAEVADAVNCR